MTAETAVKDPISVLPAHGELCHFELGRDPIDTAKMCQAEATMTLDNIALCDRHAELRMMSACGRNVKINRTK